MPADTLAKLVEANSLMRHGKLEEARAFLKQLISELGDDDVAERLVAGGLLVDALRHICLQISDKRQRREYFPELQYYTRMTLENYDRASAADLQGFRRDNDIDGYRAYIAAIDGKR